PRAALPKSARRLMPHFAHSARTWSSLLSISAGSAAMRQIVPFAKGALPKRVVREQGLELADEDREIVVHDRVDGPRADVFVSMHETMAKAKDAPEIRNRFCDCS